MAGHTSLEPPERRADFSPRRISDACIFGYRRKSSSKFKRKFFPLHTRFESCQSVSADTARHGGPDGRKSAKSQYTQLVRSRPILQLVRLFLEMDLQFIGVVLLSR